MIEFAVNISYVVMVISLLCGLVRLFKGPDTLNRILAFDFICICIIGIITTYSIASETLYYLEIILLFCLLGFASTVGFMDTLNRELEKERKKP